MPNPREYEAVFRKVLEKARAGKLTWEEAAGDEFVCDLGDNRLVVGKREYRGDTTYAFGMLDDRRRSLIHFALTDDPNTILNYDDLYTAMSELYEIARRRALKVDEQVERVERMLDEI